MKTIAAKDKNKAIGNFAEECKEYFNGLYKGENRVYVFGEGPTTADIILIGEAPGEQESLAGRPFVGKAGENLTAFLNSVSMRREEIYITNVVKFRPVKYSDKTGRAVNRPPTTEETLLWTPWLLKEINIISPKIIATLGNVALRAVTCRNSVIGEMHGKWIKLDRDFEAWLFPLYHPASIIYNRALVTAYQHDIEQLALGLSEKLIN